MKLTIKCGQGANYDQPPFELKPGVWSLMQNMRSRNGCDERVGGLSNIVTPTVAPYGLETYDIGTNSGTTRFTVMFGLAKAYAYDGTTQTEITKGITGAISNAVGGGAVVTITTTNPHGLTTGDNCIIGGFNPSGYNTAIAGQAITVTGASTFTYANTTVAAITTMGYFDSNRTSNFTAAAGEEITSCVLNGVLYFNTLLDGCYYWAGNTTSGAQGRLRRLRNDSTGSGVVWARAVRSYKDYLFLMQGVAVGSYAATSSAVVKKPYDIVWGASAEPGSTPSTFTAASSNDAGFVQKTRGAVVDALQFGETLYVYQERAVVAVDYIGGNDVFSFRYLQTTDGVAAPNCIANTSAGQFFFSQNKDLKVHSGGEAKSVAEGQMVEYIRANVDSTNYVRSFLRENKLKGEVWLCLPMSGNSTCTKAVFFNYLEGQWAGERDLSAVTCGASGMLPTTVAMDERLILGTTTPRLALTESGTTDFGSTITSLVERTGMDFGDSSSIKNIQGTRWQFDGTAGQTASIFHGAAMTADATPTYASAATATLGTSNWVNAFSTGGRYGAVKLSTTGAIGKWRSFDIDFSTSGSF